MSVCERKINSFVCLWFRFCHHEIFVVGLEQMPNVLNLKIYDHYTFEG